MRKKWVYIICIIIVLTSISIWLFNKYKPSNNHLELIPKNTDIIFTFNLKNLNTKLNTGDIKETALYQYFTLKKDSINKVKIFDLNPFLQNPMSCGVNLLSNTHAFIQMQNKQRILGMVLDVNNEKALTKTFKKSLNSKYNIIETKKYKYFKYSPKCYVAWGKKGLIILYHLDKIESKSSSLFIHQLNICFDLKSDESIACDKKYLDNLELRNDISAYINYSNLIKQINSETENNIISEIANEITDKTLHALFNVNFLQNEITVNTHFIDSIPFKILSQNYTLKPFIQTKNTLAQLNLNVNANTLVNYILKDTVLKLKLNNILKKTQFKTTDLALLIEGNFSVQVNGIYTLNEKIIYSKFNENDFSYTQLDSIKKIDYPKFSTSIGIKNFNILNSLTANFFNTNKTLPYGINWQKQKTNLYLYNDSSFLIPNTTTQNNIEAFINLKNNEYPFAIQTFINKNTTIYETYFKNNRTFESLYLTLNNKDLKTKIKVIDGNENALYKLVKSIDF